MTSAAIKQAQANIRRWREHPSQMVQDLFEVRPDPWQEEVLEAFPHQQRVAMKACAGPGKTSVLSWLGWNFLLTRPHPICGATSISGANLKMGLKTEFARWHAKSAILQQLFEQTTAEIFAKDHHKTWKLEFRTWQSDADAVQIGSSLAGIHAPYVLWLLDETGDYPEAIMPVVEGIFAGNPIEAHIVQAGNPTKLGGPLYRAWTTARKLWYCVEITADPDDPKRTSRVSVDYARQQIEQYGRENPWVLVSIFGKFPPASLNALIGPDEVEAAMKRYYREFEIGNAPKVLGVDVAREGDDASIMFPRQGIQAYTPEIRRNVTSTEGAGWVARKWAEWGADACFVDATGGFGAGWIDQLVQLGRAPFGVQYASEAHNKSRYFNKRTEMYFDAIEWIKRGGALPPCPELTAALTQTTYSFKGDRLLLEPKEIIKVKLGYSPDHADAFVQTFAEPVMAKTGKFGPSRHQVEYNPYANLDQAVSGSLKSDYDPYRDR